MKKDTTCVQYFPDVFICLQTSLASSGLLMCLTLHALLCAANQQVVVVALCQPVKDFYHKQYWQWQGKQSAAADGHQNDLKG